MAQEYTPDAEMTQDPSAAPGPGASPTLDLPEDTDGNSAANWYQSHKVNGDFIEHIQTSVRLETPKLVSTTSGISRAFSNVTHSGGGTGTVKPTAGIAIYGYRWRVLITLSGAAGVGKFKVSTNGGKTYGAEQTIAASYSDPSGVTIAFSGTFVLDDTYDFRGIDTPRAAWARSDGKFREVINHLGYPMGQIASHRENWSHDVTAAMTTTASATYFPGYSRWKYTLDADGSGASPSPTIGYVSPDLTGNFNKIKMVGSTGAGAVVTNLHHARSIAATGATSAMEAVFSWLVRVPQNDAGQSGYVGLSSSPGGMTGSHPFGVMFSFTGTGNWFWSVLDDLTGFGGDTGIGPNTGAGADWQLLQIEYYGPDSAVGVALGGGVWRFLIDGVQVGIQVYDGLVCAMQPFVRMDSTAATPAPELEAGPILWGLNLLDDPVRI